MPASFLLYRLVPATPPDGATEPLPVTWRLRHYESISKLLNSHRSECGDTYLRVQLRSVVGLTAVQGNNFVADDVVASLQVPRDSGSGCEVGFDKVVGGPGSSAAGSDQTSLRYLAPAKRTRGQGRAVTCRLYEMGATNECYSDLPLHGAM